MSSPLGVSLKRQPDSASFSSPAGEKRLKTDGSIISFFGQPKIGVNSSKPGSTVAGGSATTSSPPASSTFDKAKWVDRLTPEQKTLLKLEIDTLHESWLAHLKDELLTSSFLDLKRFLKKEIESGKKVFPPLEEVYSWSRHTPFSSVRVVLIGQDPYHNHNQAHGLCFSVRPPTPAPPSLKNMYIALANDYPAFKPPPRNSGLLTPWAEQGVLMLNACLTVRAHEAASHKNKGWESFTQKVIDTVAKTRTRGVVFLAWGSQAQHRCRGLARSGKHLVLQSVHPSPLSAHNGFMTCGHFKKTNEWLKGRYGEEGVVDWNLLQPKVIAAPMVDETMKATAKKEQNVEAARSMAQIAKETDEAGASVQSSSGAERREPLVDEDADAIEAMKEIVEAEAEAEEKEKEKKEEEEEKEETDRPQAAVES